MTLNIEHMVPWMRLLPFLVKMVTVIGKTNRRKSHTFLNRDMN